jgi:hypothetical protein
MQKACDGGGCGAVQPRDRQVVGAWRGLPRICLLALAFKKVLPRGRTRRVDDGFADSSFTLVDGQGGVTQAGVPISFSLRRFDVDFLYLGQVDDNVAVDRPAPCTITTSLDGR